MIFFENSIVYGLPHYIWLNSDIVSISRGPCYTFIDLFSDLYDPDDL